MFEEYQDLLTVNELCEVLLIGKNSAYKLLNTGQIRGFRLSRTWKIPRKSIEQFITEMSKIEIGD